MLLFFNIEYNKHKISMLYINKTIICFLLCASLQVSSRLLFSISTQEG